MTVFEIADLELFSVVPAECLGRTRLGYPMELYATLSFPIMVFTIPFVMLWTLALFRTRRRKKAWERACEQYSHSRSYKLITLGLLLVYPTVARKCLSPFNCLEVVATHCR